MLISDAFQDWTYWRGYMQPHDFEGVAMDTHIYQVFSDAENEMSESDHIQTACAKQSVLSSSNGNLWTIVGEWSPARTDCAKYLNGRGIGARYDGSYSGSHYIGSCSDMTGSGAGFSGSYKTFLRKFWEAQAMSYEKGAGWIQCESRYVFRSHNGVRY
jgi:glucan 1,3-beta-glucosidase